MIDACAPPPASGRRPYRIAGPQTWGVIRELYLTGVTAPELAERFDGSVHTVRKRVWRGGWTRVAQAQAVRDLRMPADGGAALLREPGRPVAAGGEIAGGVGEGPDGAEPAGSEADPLEAARILLRRAAGAAVAGRLAEAGAAVKLAEGLARAAAALGLVEGEDDAWDEPAEPRRSPEQLEALRDDVERRYARFDRPDAEASGADAAVGGGESWDAPAAWVAPVAPPVAPPEPPPELSRAPTPEPPTRGIGRPSRPISVSPWPAWAPRPDGWPSSGWSG